MSDTIAIPAGATPASRTRFGSNSGQPMTRRDGVLKVTGAATFAADNHPEGGHGQRLDQSYEAI